MKNEHVFASRNINKDMSITNKERFHLWIVNRLLVNVMSKKIQTYSESNYREAHHSSKTNTTTESLTEIK